MKKRLTAALLALLCAASLSGCSVQETQKKREKSIHTFKELMSGADEETASESPDTSGGSSDINLFEEYLDDDEDLEDYLDEEYDDEGDSESDRYNAYIDVYNLTTGRLADSIDRYFDYVAVQEEFVIPEYYYGCYELTENDIKDADLAYQLMESCEEKDALDENYGAFHPYLMNMINTLNEIHKYTELKNYIDDDYAKGRELHAALWTAINEYYDALEPFAAELMAAAELRTAEDLENMKESGQETMYTMIMLINSAQDIQTELEIQGIENENVLEMNLETIQPLYESYVGYLESLLEMAENEEQLKKEGVAYDNISWKFLLDSAKDAKVSMSGVIQRVRENNPIQSYEDLNLAGQATISSFHKGVSEIIKNYNSLLNWM